MLFGCAAFLETFLDAAYGNDDGYGADGAGGEDGLPVAREDVERIDDSDAGGEEEESHVVAQPTGSGTYGIGLDDFQTEGHEEQHHAEYAARHESSDQPCGDFAEDIE